MFGRRKTYQEQLLAENEARRARSVGATVVSTPEYGTAPSSPESEAYDIYAEDEEDDRKFEIEVAERVTELEAMTIPELLADAVDDLARADQEEDYDVATFHAARAAAVNNRVIALLLLGQQNSDQQ